jgi:hypothetical protein
MAIPIGIVLFLAFVLTTSVAQAQAQQRLMTVYRDCTVAAFRERVDQVNDPNLLAEMSLAACPTEEAALTAWYQWYQHRFSENPLLPPVGVYMSQLKLRLKQQMMEAAKTRHSAWPK